MSPLNPQEVGQTASKAGWLGLLFLISLAAIGGATIVIGKVGIPGWGKHQEVRLKFPRVEGLRVGNAVRVDGVDSGKVTEVNPLDEGGVEVVADLDREITIYTNGKVRIETLAFGVGAVVSIHRGDSLHSAGPMEMENGRYVGDVAPMFGDVTESAARQLRDTVREILNDIEDRGGTMSRVIADPKLYEELVGAIKEAQQMLRLLREGEGAVPMFLNDPATADQARAVLDEATTSLKDAQRLLRRGTDVFEQVNAAITDAQAGVGTVGQLMVNDEIYNQATAAFDKANTALEHANAVLDEINAGRGVVGRAVSDEAWAEKVDDTLQSVRNAAQNVEDVTGRLVRGEGSVGRALQEDGLYNQAEETLESVNSFIGRAARARLFAGADAWYFTRRRYLQGRVHLRIWPDDDKFFHVGMDIHSFSRNTRIPVRGIPPRTSRTFSSFTLQVGWRLPWFPDKRVAFKMGLLESQIGAGFEIDPPHPFFRDQVLRFLLEARLARTSARNDNWDERAGPILYRIYVQTPLWHAGDDPFEVIFGHLWLTLGANSLWRRPEFFAGLGLQYEDRDLRTLLGLVGLGF